MEPDVQKAFDRTFDKMDKGFESLNGKHDEQREEIHALNLTVQNVAQAQPVCRLEMEPRVGALEEINKIKKQRAWEVVRPIFIRLLEAVIIGAIVLAGIKFGKVI